MVDHELSVVMQQERERAIREARLHHRFGLEPDPSLRQRLMAALRRPFADRTPRQGQVLQGTSTTDTQAAACRTQGTPSGSLPG